MKTIQLNQPITLLVVVLNYKTAALTIDCLRSLVDEINAIPGSRVVVTDNASGDGSVEKIASAISENHWHDWVELMPLEKNGGFAFGNNAAIRPVLASAVSCPYVLLLNPDTVVRPGALKSLLTFMNEHPEAGIAGSRLEDLDGSPQHSAFRFPSVISELDFGLRLGFVSKLLSRWIGVPPIADCPHETNWVAGASMIIRREVFDAIGLLDENYFMYFEEVDFCLRAHRAGWSCWYVPQSHVVHFVGQSSGVTDSKRPPKRMPTYWFDSRRRYFLKNHGWLFTAFADAAWLSGFTLWRWRRAIQRKPDTDRPNLWSDFLLNSIFVRGVQL
ncbi:glycosyltransferase family 2 protein [Phormidium sp. FACHB-592]|uniref:Glycosyltransferase family 2 protein n=1 Tax=Stenomitos frigidus AS-A4 TaxID=2933935 RepID=A0ABV0KP01_9CYAN|nr:glycosyltransferase family 2 protein [Phormidium sp. FACHB-592]MBD2075040.1 glycosyltransferase family 2 protein [Phormidium sp. FACHB-592]